MSAHNIFFLLRNLERKKWKSGYIQLFVKGYIHKKIGENKYSNMNFNSKNEDMFS